MRTSPENKQPVAWLAAGALLLASALPVTATVAGSSDQWEYEATIYLWAAGIDATTPTGGDIDMSFSDILSDLDMTFMGTFGARARASGHCWLTPFTWICRRKTAAVKRYRFWAALLISPGPSKPISA